MNLTRGDVYYASIELPNPEAPGLEVVRGKLIVLLRGGNSDLRVPFLVASSDRSTSIRPFEVLVKASEGAFDKDTIIDCRWPYTITRARLEKGKHLFTLPSSVMTEINLGLVVGLQM